MKVIPRRNIIHYRGELRDIFGTITRGELKNGPYIKQFEEQFAKYIGTKCAIAVASGRLGLFLILESLSLNKNSGVILPAYTDESVPAMIKSLGLEPIFVDIDRDTHNINADLIEKKINERTKVIIATHIFGRPCNLSKIIEIAKRYNLIVIEDCAHAIGAEYNGKRVGSFGVAAYFSSGITKPINTFGGGMVTTNDPTLYSRIVEKAAELNYPNDLTIFKNIFISYLFFLLTTPLFFSVTVFPLLLFLSVFNKDLITIYNKTVKQAIKWGKMRIKYTNVQALVGIKQLEEIDEANKMRVRNASLLIEYLDKKTTILKDDPVAKPTYYFFVISTHDAKSLSRKLLINGIDTGKHIMRDCALVYENDASCVYTQEAIRASLEIPNYPQLGQEDVQYIAEVLNRVQT